MRSSLQKPIDSTRQRPLNLSYATTVPVTFSYRFCCASTAVDQQTADTSSMNTNFGETRPTTPSHRPASAGPPHMESHRDEQLETTPEKNHEGSRQSRQATCNFASELRL